MSRIFAGLEADGIDLLKRTLEYDPAKRISVRTQRGTAGRLYLRAVTASTRLLAGLCRNVAPAAVLA